MIDGFWTGFGAAFAAIGAVVVASALIWAVIAIGIPEWCGGRSSTCLCRTN